jgi:hypothetical protein
MKQIFPPSASLGILGHANLYAELYSFRAQCSCPKLCDANTCFRTDAMLFYSAAQTAYSRVFLLTNLSSDIGFRYFTIWRQRPSYIGGGGGLEVPSVPVRVRGWRR